MKQTRFPPGWDEERVQKVLARYEEQTEEEAIAEDEAAFEDPDQTVMEVPDTLVPTVKGVDRQASSGLLKRTPDIAFAAEVAQARRTIRLE